MKEKDPASVPVANTGAEPTPPVATRRALIGDEMTKHGPGESAARRMPRRIVDRSMKNSAPSIPMTRWWNPIPTRTPTRRRTRIFRATPSTEGPSANSPSKTVDPISETEPWRAGASATGGTAHSSRGSSGRGRSRLTRFNSRAARTTPGRRPSTRGRSPGTPGR